MPSGLRFSFSQAQGEKMEIGIGCRHRDVEWYDSRHCQCHQCGKAGEWFEDGFMLWRRLTRTQQARWKQELVMATTVTEPGAPNLPQAAAS